MPKEETAADRQPAQPREPLIMPGASKDSSRKKKRSSSNSYKRVGFLGYLTLIVLTLLVFAPMLQSDLAWTDYDQVERSPYLSMDSWQEAWQIDNIRLHEPLSITSYFLESQLPLPQATAHRLINLILHLAAALLLLNLLQALKLPGAFPATLIFTLHPTVLQTLFWPGYRSELVGLIFILVSLYFGIRNRGSRDFILALVFTLISSLLHPAAFFIPFVLALCILREKQVFHLQDYNRLLPIACIALFVGVWTHAGQAPQERPEDLDLLAQAGQNLYFHLRQSLFPLDLHLFHHFSKGQSYNVGAANNLLSFVLFIPFYVLIALNFRKRWARSFFLGITSFLLLLIYGMSQLGRFIDGTLAKENYALYIALPAVVALIFCGTSWLFQREKVMGKLMWPICFFIFLLVQIGLTASFSYRISDTTRMWQGLSEEWENSWLPKAALVESARKTDSDTLKRIERIELLEAITAAQPQRQKERLYLAREYRESGQDNNALREYKYLLRETNPDNELLEEAATLMDKLGQTWEANNARERMTSN